MTRGRAPEGKRLDEWHQTETGRQWLRAKRLHGWRRAYGMTAVVVEVAMVGVVVALALLAFYRKVGRHEYEAPGVGSR